MERPIRILELRSVRGTGGGPDKTILLGAARTDRRRFEITVCYIRDLRDTVFRLDERAVKLGVDYAEVHERHSFDPSVWPALRRLVRQRRIDIVHAHDYKTNLLALLLARVDGVAALATAHGWASHSRRSIFYYFLDKRVLALFRRVIAVSSDIKRELIRTGSTDARISVVLNAIDHRQFTRSPGLEESARSALGLTPSHIVIGAIGRLEREKRYDLLIEALDVLRVHRPLARLVIAGEGSLGSSLRDLARSRNLLDRCHFIGQTGDPVGLHHALDVFVQSSDNEGTSNAVLEAMALETPIVATRVGGTAELLRDGEGGLLVPRRDPSALATAIDTLLDNPEATARRVAAARRRIEHELSFDARMGAVEAVYEELFRQRQRATVAAEALA